jgi:hypothetical protein
MFRFSIRDVLWLTVVVGLVTALIASHSWKHYQYQKASQIITDDYRESLNTQFEVAKSEFHRRMIFFREGGSGRYHLPDICESIERFVRATSDSIESPEMRIEQYKSALDAARLLEDATRRKSEDDIEPAYYLDRVRYTRSFVEGKIALAQQEMHAKSARKQ